MKKKFLGFVMVIAMIVGSTGCGTNNNYKELATDKEVARTYECDVSALNFFLNVNTVISTVIDDKKVTISGSIWNIVTEPLKVTDEDGVVLAQAGDAYGLIKQDDHGIYIDGKFEINMHGNIDAMGQTYDLMDSEGNILATAEFDALNTSGGIIDVDGNLIATYSSDPGAFDYRVDIYENEICSDMSILMIMASYVSDYRADSHN